MRSKKEHLQSNLLKTTSKKAKLEEGEEGVRKILQEIYRNKRISTKELAYHTCLPIPVTAAVRKELEKEGLLTRNYGIALTAKGELFVKEQLGLKYLQRQTCPTCQGKGIKISDNFTHTLEKTKNLLNKRPTPIPWLDQTHGTAETALLRALFMLERGSIEGREILFLGDDDFTSIAVSLLHAAKRVTVIDVDHRLIETINEISEKENLEINCIKHDLKNPLPKKLLGKYDIAFTDPPYTIPGLVLFLSRGITSIRRQKSGSIYLAYAHRSPEELLKIQKTLNKMGLCIAEHIPKFNKYKGAEMFANTTSIIRLETTEETQPLITGSFTDKFYTGEISESFRIYTCSCGQQTKVGSTEKIRTIEELKTIGCPRCGKKKGFNLFKKVKLKDMITQRLKIRELRKDDYPTIINFEKEIALRSFPEAPILDENYHAQKLTKATAKTPRCLKIAVIDDEVVGWLWLRTEKDRSTSEKFGYIKSIIVKPQYRHQGIGRRLLEIAEEYFTALGIKRVDLIASEVNYDATLFFEAAGFKQKHTSFRKNLLLDEEA